MPLAIHKRWDVLKKIWKHVSYVTLAFLINHCLCLMVCMYTTLVLRSYNLTHVTDYMEINNCFHVTASMITHFSFNCIHNSSNNFT